MAESTRTVLMWFNNDQERLTFPVSPRSITLTRPQVTRELMTIGGEAIHVAAGKGLSL